MIAAIGRKIYRARGVFGVPFVLAVLMFCHPQRLPHAWLEWLRALAGWSTLLAGLLVRTWGVAAWFTRDAAGVIGGKRLMTEDGPYLYSRNPRYLGNLAMGLGTCFLAGVPNIVTWYTLLWLAVHYPIMVAERDSLLQRHDEAYANYCREVPLLVPRWPAPYPVLQQMLTVNWRAGSVEEMSTVVFWLCLGCFVEWWRAAHLADSGWGTHTAFLACIPLILVSGQRLRGWLQVESFAASDRPIAP